MVALQHFTVSLIGLLSFGAPVGPVARLIHTPEVLVEAEFELAVSLGL
jgi:hypothetical protein